MTNKTDKIEKAAARFRKSRAQYEEGEKANGQAAGRRFVLEDAEYAEVEALAEFELSGYQEASEDVVQARLAEAYALFPQLKERRAQLAGTMSGGEQAMVSIGRGLMSAPKLLLVDEPSLELSPIYVKQNFEIIRRIRERGKPCSWWSKTRARAWRSPIAATCSPRAASSPPVHRQLRRAREVNEAYFG